MKKKKIIILSILVIPILILTGGICLLEFGAPLLINEEDAKEYVDEIKSAPYLPGRYYEIYEQMYPESLTKHNHFRYLLDRVFGSKNNLDCECNKVASNTPYYGFKRILFVSYLEKKLSPKECLNYYVKTTDYFNGCKGASRASEFYFKKSIMGLNDEELIRLILMTENPALYNPKRERVQTEEKVQRTLKILK